MNKITFFLFFYFFSLFEVFYSTLLHKEEVWPVLLPDQSEVEKLPESSSQPITACSEYCGIGTDWITLMVHAEEVIQGYTLDHLLIY